LIPSSLGRVFQLKLALAAAAASLWWEHPLMFSLNICWFAIEQFNNTSIELWQVELRADSPESIILALGITDVQSIGSLTSGYLFGHAFVLGFCQTPTAVES
jgi:hypothetical protein